MDNELETQEAYNTIQDMLTTDNLVDARKLHQALGSKRQFGNWIKDKIEQGGFIEGEEVFNKFVINPTGGRPRTEFTILPDVAKEISLMEGTETGRQMRRYFILAEKQARALQNKPASPFELPPATDHITYNGHILKVIEYQGQQWFYQTALLKALGTHYRNVKAFSDYGTSVKYGSRIIILISNLPSIAQSNSNSSSVSTLRLFLRDLTTDDQRLNKPAKNMLTQPQSVDKLLLLAGRAKRLGDDDIMLELLNQAVQETNQQ